MSQNINSSQILFGSQDHKNESLHSIALKFVQRFLSSTKPGPNRVKAPLYTSHLSIINDANAHAVLSSVFLSLEWEPLWGAVDMYRNAFGAASCWGYLSLQTHTKCWSDLGKRPVTKGAVTNGGRVSCITQLDMLLPTLKRVSELCERYDRKLNMYA